MILAFVNGLYGHCQEPTTSTTQSINEIKQNTIELIGKDPALVNGIRHNNGYSGVKGDPFLPCGKQKGTIVVDGVPYKNQDIRFDILNNELILNYETSSGSAESIVLTKYWIDQFSLGEKVFRKGILSLDSSRFVQVIYKGKVSCYIDWKKEIILGKAEDIQPYFFSDPIRQGTLEIGNSQVTFRSRRSFVMQFQKKNRKKIRNYIRAHRIRFRKASTGELRDLLIFINQNLSLKCPD
jgi:hypothetical protein